MPLARGIKEYGPPILGLNTEASLLDFPVNSFHDGLNILIDYEGSLRARKRKGLAAEEPTQGTLTTTPEAEDPALKTFLWENVAQDAEIRFLCTQLGDRLYFNDPSAENTTEARKPFYVDLTDLKSGTPDGTDILTRSTPLQATEAKGALLIVSRAIDPTLIEYNKISDSLTITKLSLKIRDVLGIEDGLGIDERPGTLEDEHNYNLLNQGWYKAQKVAVGGAFVDPIQEFFTNESLYPSNADIAHLGTIEDSGEIVFKSDRILELAFGSTPAPRGHYVVQAFQIDRQAILDAPQQGTGNTGGSSYEPPVDGIEITQRID